jgi:hypothetical protein
MAMPLFEVALGARAAVPEVFAAKAILSLGTGPCRPRRVERGHLGVARRQKRSALRTRSSRYREPFNFRYWDGSRMVTFGGLLHSAASRGDGVGLV